MLALARPSREPFVELMAEMLEGAPDGDVVKEWADQHPDRYAAALLSLGQLAGYRCD